MPKIIYYIPIQFRPFLLPFATLVIIVALSLTLGNYALSNILQTRDEISSLNQVNDALSAKIEILKSVNQDTLSGQAKNALEALPSESSTLPAVGSIRAQAFARGVDVTNFAVIEVGDKKKNGSSYVQIDLSLNGKLADLLSLVEDLQNSAPLMQVSNVSVKNNGDASNARISVLTVWSPLPKNLGKPETVISSLSQVDLNTIKKLESLKKPEGGVVVPTKPQGKENPFSF